MRFHCAFLEKLLMSLHQSMQSVKPSCTNSKQFLTVEGEVAEPISTLQTWYITSCNHQNQLLELILVMDLYFQCACYFHGLIGMSLISHSRVVIPLLEISLS